MSILEITLLILLIGSLGANWRLWQLFRCYKDAYKSAVLKSEPDMLALITQLTVPLAVGAVLYMAMKQMKES